MKLGGIPRNRCPTAVAQAGIDDAVGWDVGFDQSQFFTLIHEWRARQGEQHDRGHAGLQFAAAVALAVTGNVVVGEHPGGPRPALGE